MTDANELAAATIQAKIIADAHRITEQHRIDAFTTARFARDTELAAYDLEAIRDLNHNAI
jgi:hypothetical protein